MHVRNAIAVAALVVALAASVAAAGVKTDSDPDADFSKYATYAWKVESIIEAQRPEVQAAIVATVDREAQGRGLGKAGEDPDVWIVTYVSTGATLDVTAPNMSEAWAWGGSATQADGTTKGTLIVTIIDRATDKVVWRGTATETVSPQSSAAAIEKKIDQAVRKMFRDYPPSGKTSGKSSGK